MQHVASKPAVPAVQHPALSQRDRAAETGHQASPFASLLDETTSPPPSSARDHCGRTQQSNGSSSCHEARPARRTDTDRTPDSPDTDAEPSSDPDAVDDTADVDTSAPTDEDTTDPAADAAVTIDTALAAAIDPPASPPPTAAAVPTAADIVPPIDGDTPSEAGPPTVPAATDAAPPVPPSDMLEAAAQAAGSDAIAPAASTASEAAAPETPIAADTPTTDTPPVPSAADRLAAASEADPTAGASAAVAADTDEMTTTAEENQAEHVPQAPATGRRPDHAATPDARSMPATETAASPTPPQPSTDPTTPPAGLEHAEAQAAQQSEDADAQPSESTEQPAADATERRQSARSPGELVQAHKPSPDNILPPPVQTGRDLGQPTAAQTLHNADQSNPINSSTQLAAASVPVDSLAVAIAARAQAGSSRFEIRLDPPELGRIDVRLDIDRSGQVTSRLVVERAETLDVLRRDAHQLERALQDAGLKTSDNSLQFSLRDQSFAQHQNRDDLDFGQTRIADPELPAAEGAAVAYGLTLRGGSGVDIRV